MLLPFLPFEAAAAFMATPQTWMNTSAQNSFA
jgi:hypothetical protein